MNNDWKKELQRDLKIQLQLLKLKKNFQKIIIIGIGSNKEQYVNFDTFGPRVCSYLKEANLPNQVECYGTMNSPLHALNLMRFYEKQEKEIKNNLTIAVDAMATLKYLEKAILVEKGIYPGKALGKKLPRIGDLSICGGTIVDNSNILFKVKELSIADEKIIEMSKITAQIVAEEVALILKK